ncbi:NYN domain-containing protein [Patescibacteria group bacterium]|nr:NYN domain-containing protein [Patescibacteria group bacterium]MBU1673952.1 NYN domain-containing protein [Patescibacteria group bacterium]MBU1963946.1 NYN domain-containing protein [Patescibacteria group bacterium]
MKNDKIGFDLPSGPDHFKPFLRLVDNYAQMTGQKIIVALDWRTDKNISADYRYIQVATLGDHHSADEVIMDILDKMSGGKANVVVTNDHEIKRRANARGWQTMPSEEFARRILDTQEDVELKNDPGAKKDVELNDAEVDQWEEFFKGPRPKMK